MLREKVEANEALRAKQCELGMAETEALPFLCECDDLTCRTVIRMPADEYTTAREAPNRYVCLVDHPHGGRIVAKLDGYAVFEDA